MPVKREALNPIKQPVMQHKRPAAGPVPK